MCRYLVYNLMNEIHYNWILNFHRLRISLQSIWHWRGFSMDTDLLIANRLNERLSVERSLHAINTGVQNQSLVAYPVMIYRWWPPIDGIFLHSMHSSTPQVIFELILEFKIFFVKLALFQYEINRIWIHHLFWKTRFEQYYGSMDT